MQLAALLGKEAVQIRKTDGTPPKISVIDVVQAITDQTQSNSAVAFQRLMRDHPEVGRKCSKLRFNGERQRDTPVTDAKANGVLPDPAIGAIYSLCQFTGLGGGGLHS